MNDMITDLIYDFSEAMIPQDDLTLTEWSDRYRFLPSESASERGPWRTSRFPFLKEIMDLMGPESETEQIVVMKGAQLGLTEVAINWIFYTIDYDPAPLLYVQKTIDTVEKFSKQRFSPSAEVCPIILDKIGRPKSRDSGNTIRLKTFPGGIIILGGANSAASLRSMPIERLILDEEESYDADLEEEGSPSEIAIRRTANFPKRKIFRLSTPAIKETSRIEPLFEAGDQRRYYVPCIHCGHYQVIYWRHIKYEEKKTEALTLDTVHMECESCHKEIPERFKTEMLERGKWKAENKNGNYPSFHISSLYTPLGFYSWRDAVRSWLKVQKTMDKSLLKVFINTVLGETFSEANKTIEATGLMKRKEAYTDPIPDGVLVLTAGVDVQNDRLEVEVVGFGKNQESWSIDYTAFMGDTEHSFVWEQLDAYLQRTWSHASGLEMNLALVAIDSGHRARVVYNFCKTREHRRIFPVKGRDGWGYGYIKRPLKRNEDKVYLFLVYVDEVKSKIYSHLQISEPGAGYCHFPEKPVYNQNYFKMLTSERLTTKKYRGRTVLRWDLPQGRRNEALDCRAYAIAALNILNPNFEMLGDKGPMVVSDSKLRKKKRRTRQVSKGIG